MNIQSIANTAVATVSHIGRILTIGLLVVFIMITSLRMIWAWIDARGE